MTAAWCVAAGAMAQQADTLRVVDDNADFTFTESQLDEDNDGAQTVSAIVASKTDPYLAEVGYLFSPMRFRVRGYDNMYNQVYMNGLMLNDLETGRFSYGLIGGMNDATRNQEGVSGFEFNNFGMTGVGGGTSINTRASQFAQGNKITLSGCNRNYLMRGMFTHATGLMENGWAFAGTVGYRWANEGVIDGTFYNSFSYFLSAEKRFNDAHSLSLVTFGSPTERGQQAASTEEAYWLANSHYYNPNWGFQNGEKRNARVVKSFEPTAILTWDWDIDRQKKLTTAAGFKYSNYGTTALGWNGDAYDPRPDYYKNMPSSIFDVYNPDINNPGYLEDNPFLLEQWRDMYDYWTSSEANRQINWDRMYFVNRQNEANGGETLYYQERRHNDQMVFALNSVFNHTLSPRQRYTVGLQLNTTKGMHYKTMEDLLGGTRYTDIDKFAANDYGKGSIEAQNDLNNPNRQIAEGDKFGYDYNTYVNKARLWGQYQYTAPRFAVLLGANAEGTTIERDGLMRNGRAPDNSYGRRGKARFLGGGGKFRQIHAGLHPRSQPPPHPLRKRQRPGPAGTQQLRGAPHAEQLRRQPQARENLRRRTELHLPLRQLQRQAQRILHAVRGRRGADSLLQRPDGALHLSHHEQRAPPPLRPRSSLHLPGQRQPLLQPYRNHQRGAVRQQPLRPDQLRRHERQHHP